MILIGEHHLTLEGKGIGIKSVVCFSVVMLECSMMYGGSDRDARYLADEEQQ